MSKRQSGDDWFPKAPLWLRAKYTLLGCLSRTRRKIWSVNAECNNEDCGYLGRRTRRGKWCPACWDDGGGELIRFERTKRGSR